MTISGKSFLNLQTQRDKLEEKTTSNELSSGTQSNPQPIQIKSSAAQTISDATKKNINPAIIQMNSNPTPGAVMTAGTPTTKEEDQKAMTEALLQQKKKVDAETKGINADHTNPYSLAHYVQSASELLFGAKTAYTTWGTKSIADVEASAERELELDYNAAKTKIQENRTKEANKKFSDIFAGNTPKTDIQLSANFGPRFGIQNGIGSLNWLGNYQNKWITNDGSEVMMSNGKTTISNPIIHTPDYQGDLAKAYDTVTYAAAQDGVVVTPEYLKENFPGFRDQPDEVVQNFIEDCMYDVQVGEKRPLEMYSNYYQGLAKSDNYVNKQDSIIDAITNEDIIDSSLGYFMAGSIEMDGRTAEEWQEYVNAAYTIKARANAINNEGFNETGAGDYILVKTFADQIPELKQAIDTYDKFDIKTVELLKLQNQYNATIQDAKDFMSKVDWSTQTEYNQMIRRYAHDYLDQFNRDFMNNWNTERLQGKLWTAGEGWFDSWLYGKYYEKNGKWYDKDGNEISPEEAQEQKAFINDYLDGIMQISRQADELGFDLQRASESYGPESTEMYADAIFDSVNLAFNAAMSFTGMGVKFQAMTHLPYVGTVVEGIFNFLMEDVFGNIAMGIADMTQFANGWEKESIEKYKQAVEGLGIMVIGSAKAKLLGKAKARISDKALVKAWKAATQKFVDKLIKLDVEPAKLQQLIRESNALPEETGKKPTTRKEVEQQRKSEQKAKTEGKEVEGEKVEGEKVEGEKTEGTKKPMFTTNVFKEAMSEFNRVFEEEYIKENADGKGSIIDDLFEKARNLYTALTQERSNEINTRLAELEKKAAETGKEMETKALETPTEETVSLTETTPETATQPAEQTTVSETIETAPETPGIKVEQASTKAPTDVEGKIETKESKAIEEKKTTINKILDFIQDVQNTTKDIVKKIAKAREEKKDAKSVEKRAIKREKDRKILMDALGNNEELVNLVMDSPFGQTILDVVNATTREVVDPKSGKVNEVVLKKKLENPEIKKEILSEGIKAIQEYVDRLGEMRSKLGEIYEELSMNPDIDTFDFAESEALGNVLKGFGYKIEIRFDEETEQPYAVVSKVKNVRPKPSEAAEMEYIQDFINKQLRFEKISEADAQAVREWLTWNEDKYGKNKRKKAFENSVRDAFNKFLDEQKGTELLRTIDKGYNKISEAIKDLKEILDKKNDVKENAASRILKWDEETLNQMEEIVPGISKLVELANKAPDIVQKIVNARMDTKKTLKWLAGGIRYTFVGLPSYLGMKYGGAQGGFLGFLFGSFMFKWSENLGNYLQNKMQSVIPNLKIYNTFVDNLKLDPKAKELYKTQAYETILRLRELTKGERERDFRKTMEEVNEILIERDANDIINTKGIGEEPTKPTGPDDTTPPSAGGAGEGEKLTPKEEKIVEASLAIDEGKQYSEKSQQIADELTKLDRLVDDVMTDYATEKLEERGEDVTPQSIAKIKEEPMKEESIMDFLNEMEAGEEHTVDPTKPDYRKTDLDTLIEIAEHPEKYPDVDIEAVNDAIEYITQKNIMAEASEGGGMRGSDINMDYKFAAEVDRVNGMEQRMADAKTPETKEKLKKEWIKAKEDVIEEISQAYNIDQFEAADKFDQLSNASLKTIEQGNKVKNGYKGKHRIVKAEQDKLLALMGKGPSQNITYTSSSDNIAKMENPASRKRVAEQRIRQVVDPKIEKSKIGVNKDKINRNVAKRTAEKQALEAIIEKANEELKGEQEKLDKKIELAKETKKLIDKRKNTKSREEKKELTKEIDKNEDAFEKLTYEEAGELFSKPKEVEEMEAKEQAGKDEFDKAMDENETPQKSENEIDDTEGISILYTNEAYESGMPEAEIWRNNEKIGERNPFSGITGKLSDTQKQYAVKEINNRSKTTPDNKKAPKTVKELKEKGFTDEEIEKLQNLNIASDPLNEYLKNSTKVPEAYKAMNRELADVQAEFVDTMRALSKLDNYEGELRRGGNGKEFGENIKEGDTIENKQLLFSSDVKIEDSAYKDSPVYYKINAKGKGTKDSVIEGGKERDFVTMPGQKFKVEKITKEGDKTIYEITEIDDTAEPTKKVEEKKPEPKKETPKTEDKKVESKKEKGSEPLIKVEANGKIEKEPMVGDLKTQDIYDRMQYIRAKAKEAGKIFAREANELRALQELYKRQVEFEAREEQGDITDDDYVKAYETGGGGVNHAPF